MNYEETVDYLFTQTPVFQRDGASAYKPGLHTALKLSEAFGNPHLELGRTIHVAGTNGKGSTSHTLAAILQSAGLRTGLYTSPHLTDFRERIRVNGQMIEREAVVDFVRKYLSNKELQTLRPSFFELSTIMAFDWFRRQNVDVAVIEVGLGGLLDTTNIITPSLSIITNISPDHTSLLGSTLAEIASQKAGIIKEGVPVVIGEAGDSSVREVFESKAARMHSDLFYAEPIPTTMDADGRWIYYGKISGELRGEFQPLNASTVMKAIEVLSWPEVNADAVAKGFANVEELTGLRGRLSELKGAGCKLVYDTGHNPGAWEYIGRYLSSVVATQKVYVVGFAADKDVDCILSMLPADGELILTRPTGNRGMDAEVLAAKAESHGLKGVAIESVSDAVTEAVRLAGSDGFVFVGGSNFVVADLLKSFGEVGS